MSGRFCDIEFCKIEKNVIILLFSAVEAGGDEKDHETVLGETVVSLNSGLLKVKSGNIREWNLHKHVKGDRELKPIMIPF